MVGVGVSGMFRAASGINSSKDNVKDGNRMVRVKCRDIVRFGSWLPLQLGLGCG